MAWLDTSLEGLVSPLLETLLLSLLYQTFQRILLFDSLERTVCKTDNCHVNSQWDSPMLNLFIFILIAVVLFSPFLFLSLSCNLSFYFVISKFCIKIIIINL